MLTDLPLSQLLPVIAVAALLIYWEARELLTSRADKHKGNHLLVYRILIRLILPVVGLVLILQLMNIISWDLPVTSTTKNILFSLGQVLFWLGVAISIWARETIGRHWAHAAEYQVVAKQKLITIGPYQYVRHPIYTALLLIFISTQLIASSWLLIAAIPLYQYITWQASKEEGLLQNQFGEAYRKYKKHTGMIMPKL